MTLHKLTAGDGYLYLVRQVAAADATERGRSSLADYYSAKGEAPGQWVGRGLAALTHTGPRQVSEAARAEVWAVPEGSAVSEDQMKALFGDGLHPNADAIIAHVAGRGLTGPAALHAARLGRKFHVRDGEPEFARRLAVAYRDYNAERDQRWNAPIDPDERATIRTRIATEVFAAQYGRPPADDRELSGFIARNTRARTTAVAGYDLTFSPVKSVSALWAIAPPEVARTIENAHDLAVAEVLEWLQDNASFTRTGTDGVAQVDTEGLIAAAFTHRDSRAGDPDLHTHVAVSNKVSYVDATGVRRWLALDGQPLHRVTVAASELYNTRIEAHMCQQLGVRFAETPAPRGKRPVREIVGMSTELMTHWSSRRLAIESRTAELAKQFQATHGREPTNVESIALSQQATLESREAKHEPRSLAEQRQTWRAQAIEVLGHKGLTRMLSATLADPHRTRAKPARITETWINERAGEVVSTVAQQRARWQRHHVLAEAQRAVRSHGHAHTIGLAETITDKALAELSIAHARVPDAEYGEPAALRRHDGASVYSRHGTQQYTSEKILSAERRIIAAVRRHDGRRARANDVDLAVAGSGARGKKLNPGQTVLVDVMATSGRRVELALAPAGSGKTTAMAALSAAWRNSGGRVIGLAPTAAAAIELSSDLNAPTDTLAKYAHTATGGPGVAPDWFADVDASTLIIIDEVAKAATLELDAVISHALAAGASVRLVGDDCQLSSISAGGVVRDIATETDALTLSEIVRFHSPAEAAATLALRDGDPAGIGYYIDHHRVHVGAEQTAVDMAYTAWSDDIAHGRDSVILAPTNPIVTELNARARLDRLTRTTAPVGREVMLADHLAASVGDVIRTRENARWLPLGSEDFVRNGYRYVITEITDDGAVKARHLGSGRIATLPADYVSTRTTLGYATTIDSAQGMTAGHACHVVGSDGLNRQLLYVAMTRGRTENHLYLSTAEADPHRVLTPKATHPDTAVDVLTRALARDGAQVSATTAARQAEDPAARLAAAAAMYYDALGTAAENQLGAHARERLDTTADTVLPGLTHRQAWPVLRRHLALLTINGADPHAVLSDALAQGGMADADDPAAVLDWRIDPTGTHSAGIGPLRWLPAAPPTLLDHPEWGSYLQRREQLVIDLADQIRDQARGWTNATAPAWARPLITVNPALTAEIAVFRAATGVADTDTRLTGPHQYAVRARAVQDTLYRHATAEIGRRGADTSRYNDLVDSLDPRIREDAYWPQLADHLAHAAHSRADLRALITAAAQQAPLPDELPAAALWWRLAGTLSHTATLRTTHSRLRPPWVADVARVFGEPTAETMTSDPAWPALVAAISAADPDRWTPLDLLTLAAERIADIDPDRHIPSGDYARMVTYTVDLFTHAPDHGTDNLELHHDDPPLTAEDEEQLPPDPLAPPPPDNIDHTGTFQPDPPPPPDEQHPEIDGLEFDDLPRHKPVKRLDESFADLRALRDEYHHIDIQINQLSADIRAEQSPAISAAMDDLVRMREMADADRPHQHAILAILDEWADAEAAYDTIDTLIAHHRGQLEALQASPDADPADIASERSAIELLSVQLPAQTPAERYHPALMAATAERAEAAGGPDKIVTETDIAARRRLAEHDDRAALAELKTRRESLHNALNDAERAAAASFAEAATRSGEHLHSSLDAARTEMALLHSAIHSDPEHIPIPIADAAVEHLDPAAAAKLRTLAAQPFTVTHLDQQPSHDATEALHALRHSANAADRRVLWLAATEDSAEQARRDELADTATTLTDGHRAMRDDTATIGSGDVIVIDQPARAGPAMLADVAATAAARRARIILLDDTSQTATAPGPSTPALRLLATTLPWSTSLAPSPAPRSVHSVPSPDLDPVVTRAARTNPELLDDSWRDVVDGHAVAADAARSAHKRHLTANWLRRSRPATERDRARDLSHGVDDEL